MEDACIRRDLEDDRTFSVANLTVPGYVLVNMGVVTSYMMLIRPGPSDRIADL